MKSKRTGIMISGLAVMLAGAGLCTWHFAGAPAAGTLKVDLETKPTVMTVAYKAYGNAEAADGKYWLGKLVMKNTGESPLSDLNVSYRVPEYIDWTTPDTAAEVLPGQSAVLPIYPRFPKSVTEIRTRTPSQLEVKIEYTADGKKHSSVEKRPFEFRGITEIEYTSIASDEMLSWYDMWDNKEVLAAYMTDEDEVVKAYFGKISETMGGTPYVSSNKDLVKLTRAIYDFEVNTGLVYMGAKGVPETLGDSRTVVQSIKLPRDVIRGNSGTCIELTLLMSSLLKQCGVNSFMVLVPGHAFPVIASPSGQLVPFECTGVGGTNLGGVDSFEKALAKGAATWKKCQEGKLPFVLINYSAEQAKGMRPPELDQVDVTALSQMLASRIKNRQPAVQQVVQPQQPQVQQQLQQRVQIRQQPQVRQVVQPDAYSQTTTRLPNFTTYRDPTNVLSFQYPGTWATDMSALQSVQQGGAPWYLFNAEDPQTGWSVAAFGFGSTDHSACVQALGELGVALGLSMSFGNTQQTQINGMTWTITPIQYIGANGVSFSAELRLVTIGSVTYGVGISGPAQTEGAAAAQVNQVLGSINLNNGE